MPNPAFFIFAIKVYCRIKFAFYSAQYDTARSQFLSILKFEYLGENETKFKNILTHWPVAQADSNDEKKLGVENLVGLSLPLKLKLLRQINSRFESVISNNDSDLLCNTVPISILYSVLLLVPFYAYQK